MALNVGYVGLETNEGDETGEVNSTQPHINDDNSRLICNGRYSSFIKSCLRQSLLNVQCYTAGM
jgi:hypothetical protein